MPSRSKKSYGPEVQARVKNLLQVLLEGVAEGRELKRGVDLKWIWSEDGKTLTLGTTLRSLVLLAHPNLATNTDEFKSAKSKAGESLNDLRDYVGILDDHRTQKRGSEKWHFSLQLWGQDIQRNLAEFDKLWESKRAPASKPKPAPETPPKSPLKPGVPFPKVRLPENFVERSDALKAVKEKLLAESDQTLVVSAIAGLGGLGKSVLAAALVLDPEVQARFDDGILWVTMGQSPALETMLGEWIRELDKSREAFSANTLGAASQYLDSLLAERRMLLVVDDAWNSADVEWFRVGGAGCRVLITTREAQIEGADYHQLDLMSEEEAIALVRKKLGRQWRSEQEVEVKAFAKILGRLPLALDLAANQVREGLTWAELQSEFEVERRSVALGTGRRSSALKLLDSLEKWEELDENQQRKYSLQACFNLSLKRLNPEQLQQFAWLGILPEDVNLNQQVASVLWALRPTLAKRVLVLLRKRSFLTDGVPTSEGEQTYRIHDLMHDMARGLIEEATLDLPNQNPNSKISNLSLAHQQFLERYRERSTTRRWDGLPNDGYIHRRLTWHMEQAGWADELHALLGETAASGRNGWHEARERLGQTAGYITDIRQAQSLLNQKKPETLNSQIIGLQCKYALMTASLNSVSNIPGELLVALVKQRVWMPEQGLAYARQVIDPQYKARNLTLLVEELPDSLQQVALHEALKAAQTIEHEYERSMALVELVDKMPELLPIALESAQTIANGSLLSKALSALADRLPEVLTLALEATHTIRNEYSEAMALADLANKLPAELLPKALESAQAIGDENAKAMALAVLVDKLPTDLLPKVLEVAQAIEDTFSQSLVLAALANKLPAEFLPQALKVAQAIRDESFRFNALGALADRLPELLPKALEVARAIRDKNSKARALSILANKLPELLTEALEAAKVTKLGSNRFYALIDLIDKLPGVLPLALENSQAIGHEVDRFRALTVLADKLPEFFPQALDAAQAINSESSRSDALVTLADKLPPELFPQALESAKTIRNGNGRARALAALANRLPHSLLPQALEAAQAIGDEADRSHLLATLADQLPELLPQALEAAQAIGDENPRSIAISVLADKLPPGLLPQALKSAQAIEDKFDRAIALATLANRLPALLPQALESAQAIEDALLRAIALAALADRLPEVLPQALDAAKATRAEMATATALELLADKLPAELLPEALESAKAIRDGKFRARALTALANQLPEILPKALETIQTIQFESDRATALADLVDKLPTESLPQIKQAIQAISDKNARSIALAALANKLPEVLPQALEAAHAIENEEHRSTAFTAIFPKLVQLPTIELYQVWQNSVDWLAALSRPNALRCWASLTPIILRLGGKDAVSSVAKATNEVCHWWK